jgi:hypothetical protein
MMCAKGQIWVETVIYLLITIVLIGAVFSFATPQIEKFRDRVIIEQSRDILFNIDSIIKDIHKYGVGNQRLIKINLKKGTLKISGVNDRLVFEIESKDQYIEPNSNYSENDLEIQNEKKGNLNIVRLTKDYSLNYNLTYQQIDKVKTLNKGSLPYEIIILNKGINSDGRIEINFEVK